ncbi:hypothetical protein MAE02_06530 [Microvirga aerophila]|uniref:Uncharacterized protein n=1 Tax=Microvirga aerophila TaxID=670291 RepID=A0A512BM60_9HYPH|nr:hypothetical protein MAE02_06530 [Microvirga aerophila]
MLAGMFELVQQMLLGVCHDLVPATPASYIRCRVSGGGLGDLVVGLSQRLERLPVGTTFSNGPLPAAIAHHGFNLQIDTVAIGTTAHFRQGYAWDNEEGQGQKKLSQHLALHRAGVAGA